MREFFFAIAVVLAVAPAGAQTTDPAVGSRLGQRTAPGQKEKADDAIRAAHRYADCVYFSRDRTVRRWLTTVDQADFKSASISVYQPVDCDMVAFADPWVDSVVVGNSLSASRGALAEAALRKEGYLSARAAQLPVLALAEGYDRPWFAMTGRSPTVNAMSACFADTQPTLIFNLLRTTPTSTEEGTAFRAITATLGSCLIGGASLRANAFTLRGSLAEAYFHRVYEPAGDRPTPAKAK